MKKCEHNERVINSGNVWCRNCGLLLEDMPVWTHSYANPCHYKRSPVYSRIKRFIQYLQKINKDEVNENVNDILDVFSLIEFQWALQEHDKRKYFYNRYVVLYFIAKILGLDIKLRTLKDSERVKDQIQELCELLENMIEMFN